ncbi:MAG: ABC transporter ATP-binding protein [Phycisphaerae bacterium]|nr:ABC transporter ATP-binding protein [Phycisphaerae bacterium]
MSDQPLLEVRDLQTYFFTEDGVVRAVDGASFDIRKGETFALVGESGCGKSVTAFSILQLLPTPPAKITSGSISLDGVDLLKLSKKKMQGVRGGKIGMVFQEPMTSLNPVFTCGNQISEAILLHRKVSRKQARKIGIELLDRVGIPSPDKRYDEYPHQLSGGMRQRVMIAMGLSCNPQLLIADEPTTALDVTIQAQILDLLKDIQRETDLSIMLITHDLAVVAETAHHVAVMYASKIVEKTDTQSLFEKPLHPYTQGLLRSVPKLGQVSDRLETIPGTVPNPLVFPLGCKFHPRCPIGCKNKKCQTEEPQLREVKPGHFVACWLVEHES